MNILKLLKGAEKVLDTVEQISNKAQYYQAKSSHHTIGGKTISEWDQEWQFIGRLDSVHLTPFNKFVGLYRAYLDGRLVYIGRAVEWNNGGFRKRLSDYRRESNSARKHTSGRLMFQHKDELQIEILITGSDQRSSEIAKSLEKIMIGKYNPPWNKQG